MKNVRHIGVAIVTLILCIPLIYFLARFLDDSPGIVPENHGGADSGGYKSPVHLVNLENKSVNESSGIGASRINRGILWTHNDSGAGPFIFAFDRKGKHRGVWRVAGAGCVDWEDMALGPGPAQGRSYL